MRKPCKECIDGPNKFSGAFQPLSILYKHGWHVHDNSENTAEDRESFIIYKDDIEEANREIRESLGISNGKNCNV